MCDALTRAEFPKLTISRSVRLHTVRAMCNCCLPPGKMKLRNGLRWDSNRSIAPFVQRVVHLEVHALQDLVSTLLRSLVLNHA
jgi:hypothetical protein